MDAARATRCARCPGRSGSRPDRGGRASVPRGGRGARAAGARTGARAGVQRPRLPHPWPPRTWSRPSPGARARSRSRGELDDAEAIVTALSDMGTIEYLRRIAGGREKLEEALVSPGRQSWRSAPERPSSARARCGARPRSGPGERLPRGRAGLLRRARTPGLGLVPARAARRAAPRTGRGGTRSPKSLRRSWPPAVPGSPRCTPSWRSGACAPGAATRDSGRPSTRRSTSRSVG